MEALLSIGDHWERSYGDLEWQGTIPERVMPWYFLTFDGETVNGYGVKTQPSAFCFWQRDTEGITLSIDMRNGGEATELGNRELHACTVVTQRGRPQENIFQTGVAFCKRMCSNPRLPKGSLFGINDWNYAYGKNTATGILRNADLVAALAPPGDIRPHIVIDDGWQDPIRFPSMPELARQIRSRQLRPGLWVRPLRAGAGTTQSWLLPDSRFGNGSPHNNLAFDPTHPEALDEAMKSVRVAVGWGYEFIKHDFTTFELFGRWGSEMRGQPARPGLAFLRQVAHERGDRTGIFTWPFVLRRGNGPPFWAAIPSGIWRPEYLNPSELLMIRAVASGSEPDGLESMAWRIELRSIGRFRISTQTVWLLLQQSVGEKRVNGWM